MAMDVLFEGSDTTGPKWITRAVVGALYLAGLCAWLYVMGAGRVSLNFHDWADITLPRLQFVQQSLRGHQLPLHMARSNALHAVTERFLSIPDVITSPQSLLLTVLSTDQFVLVDVLIHFTIGFAALLLLRRYFDWSLFTFGWVFLLTLFNGHVLSHYSVGHFTWGAYFLFPLVALWLFRFLDGDDSWTLLAGLAATLCYMTLAGGYHQFTWILLLMIMLVPFCWDRARWIVGAVAAACLLSAVRLLPPALELEAFRRAGFVTDVHGYPSLMHLAESLVYLRREHHVVFRDIPANLILFDERFWEYNVYIGVVGAAAVAWGGWRWLSNPLRRYRELSAPLAIMTALSMGSVYRLPRLTGIPLLLGERATSRIFSLVLVLLIVLSATEVDRWLRAIIVPARRQLALIAFAFLTIDIASSIRLQRVAISSGTLGSIPLNPSAPAYYSDPVYLWTLAAGITMGMVAASTLTVLVLRERRVTRKRTAPR